MIKGLSNKLEDITRHHYGADQDMLRIVPAVTDKEVAHTIAIGVNKDLDGITEEDLQGAVARGKLRAKFDPTGRESSSDAFIREKALIHRLTTIAVNAEIHHANLAPQDFNEDARLAGPNPMPTVDYDILPDLRD